MPDFTDSITETVFFSIIINYFNPGVCFLLNSNFKLFTFRGKHWRGPINNLKNISVLNPIDKEGF